MCGENATSQERNSPSHSLSPFIDGAVPLSNARHHYNHSSSSGVKSSHNGGAFGFQIESSPGGSRRVIGGGYFGQSPVVAAPPFGIGGH